MDGMFVKVMDTAEDRLHFDIDRARMKKADAAGESWESVAGGT